MDSLMHTVEECLHLVPVPYLAPAFSALRLIYTSVKAVKWSKGQLADLVYSVAQVLTALNGQYEDGKLREPQYSAPREELIRLLQEIRIFIEGQAACGFLKSLYLKDDRVAQIGSYNRRLNDAVHAFELWTLDIIEERQRRQDQARQEDQKDLYRRLDSLQKDNQQLQKILTQGGNISPVLVFTSLQGQILQGDSGERERQFYAHSLQYLSTVSGTQVLWEPWMVTSFDVTFGEEIGSGGFGMVYRGCWNKTEVALKVLRTAAGVVPTKELRREIEIWRHLRHAHVLQFLAANVLDDKPFIVMPYLRNGNARDYVRANPDCDRVKILHDISLALVYLHNLHTHPRGECGVVHGDLKAQNVLIDDSGMALLCDFGLSRLKSSVRGRTILGSRNWMAPEQLTRGTPRPAWDIYAFGMVIYEIYTDKTPLGHLDPAMFFHLVVHEDVRPQRPHPHQAPYLTEVMWQLAERCWVKPPSMRPTADELCDVTARARNDAPDLLSVSSATSLAHMQSSSQGYCTADEFSQDSDTAFPDTSPINHMQRIPESPPGSVPSTPGWSPIAAMPFDDSDPSSSRSGPRHLVINAPRNSGSPVNHRSQVLQSHRSSTSDEFRSTRSIYNIDSSPREGTTHEYHMEPSSGRPASGHTSTRESIGGKIAGLIKWFPKARGRAVRSTREVIGQPDHSSPDFWPLEKLFDRLVSEYAHALSGSPITFNNSRGIESGFLDVFFATYRAFTTCSGVYEGLRSCFDAIKPDASAQSLSNTRLGIVSVMRDWVRSDPTIDPDVLVQMGEFAESVRDSLTIERTAQELAIAIENAQSVGQPMTPDVNAGVPICAPARYDPKTIASALTELEGRMFSRLCPADYILHLQRPEFFDRVAEALAVNMKITFWVKQILNSRDGYFDFFFFIAKECYQNRNFSTAIAITLGLITEPVKRLGLAIIKLSKDDWKLLISMSSLVTSESAYRVAVGSSQRSYVPRLAYVLNGLGRLLPNCRVKREDESLEGVNLTGCMEVAGLMRAIKFKTSHVHSSDELETLAYVRGQLQQVKVEAEASRTLDSQMVNWQKVRDSRVRELYYAGFALPFDIGLPKKLS